MLNICMLSVERSYFYGPNECGLPRRRWDLLKEFLKVAFVVAQREMLGSLAMGVRLFALLYVDDIRSEAPAVTFYRGSCIIRN